MPATKKKLTDRYRHRMDDETRRMLYASLKWERHCLSGKARGPLGPYDINLGDRRKNLRKSSASLVVRLALGRYNAW